MEEQASDEEEKKAYQEMLKKLREIRQANKRPEQAMDDFEKYMEKTIKSDSKKEMQDKVKTELEHIPDWPEPQGELRAIYWMRRMHSLGKNAVHKQTAKDVLEECISCLKDDYPDLQFKYDKDFFNKCD